MVMLNIGVLLAVLFGVALVGAIGAKLLRLPLLVGYLVAGVVLAFVGLGAGAETGHFMENFGQIGVTFLLFLIGLEFPLAQLKQVGKTIIVAGVSQVAISSILGLVWLMVWGVNPAVAIYLAPAMAFGSTIVVVKVLSEKRELASLAGKLSLGFLLIQDFVALGMLTVLSAGGDGMAGGVILKLALKAVLLLAITVVLAGKIGPWVLQKLSSAGELLYVGALAWCLIAAALISLPVMGFTPEIGGFLAGLALAGANEHLQIAARFRPLRDFFLVVFFVGLGAQVQPAALGVGLKLGLALAAFALVVNPVIVMGLLRLSGYQRRTWFLAGLNVGQLSEFSLILTAVVVRQGLAGEEVISMFIVGSIIAMGVSGYLMFRGEAIYRWLMQRFGKRLTKLAKGEPKLNLPEPRQNHVVLFGHDRTGGRILPDLEKLGLPVVVVDFNPNQIQTLSEQAKDVVYGDMGDVELYEELNLAKAKLVVSTVVDREDNLELLEYVQHLSEPPVVVLTAANSKDEKDFYKAGANFVLVPQLVGGDFLAGILRDRGVEPSKWERKKA